ncbi:hypothetical protein PVK06_023795 [Gossypium arboreum]|uniref:Uncharacterized protein n=1 Tax=Gossypium arboreum TaxID=29729 RepID=A0ABR0PCL6_GOSAR|nr:hypothetical protein PVK06_023795 [Gossypium arboreum]
MQDMNDILIRLIEHNGGPMLTPLLDMFESFPPSCKEDSNNEGYDNNDDGEEKTPIIPPNLERVFRPNCPSTKSMWSTTRAITTRPILREGWKLSISGAQ